MQKYRNQFRLITFFFNYLEVSLALSFWFFLVEVVYVTFDIQTDLKNETSLTLEANSKTYSEPCQTSKIEVFAQIVNGF